MPRFDSPFKVDQGGERKYSFFSAGIMAKNFTMINPLQIHSLYRRPLLICARRLMESCIHLILPRVFVYNSSKGGAQLGVADPTLSTGAFNS
jgi:hypothetical protein